MTENQDWPPSARSQAEFIQGGSTVSDRRLIEEARKLHPTVIWWWGIRVAQGRRQALCYVCDEVIDQWASGGYAPKRAVASILEHRLFHIGEFPHEDRNPTIQMDVLPEDHQP